MDIESNQENKLFLLDMIETAKQKGLFSKDLPQDFIPTGPMRNDPKELIEPSSEEAINQILRHDPGLTRERINQAYALVRGPFHAVSTPLPNNNEQRLNNVTFSFFENKAPAVWKVYPSEKLKGKYTGHEVRFFTLPVEHSAKATPFVSRLQKNGFETELKQAGEKPSIVVDLTLSKKLY